MAFSHSIKVPTQYKKAAVIIKKAVLEKKGIKALVYNQTHVKIPNLLALLAKYCRYKEVVEGVIEKSQIITENPRLDIYLCRVLVTELLFGKKKLQGRAKPIQCVLSYMEKFEKLRFNHEKQQIRNVTHPRYVRVNTNILSLKDAVKLIEDCGWKYKTSNSLEYQKFLMELLNLKDDEYTSDIHVKELLVFPPKSMSYWAKSRWVIEKKFILQDKATCLVSFLLNPPPNSTVLDMCAAPGIKTTHLSSIMQNKGKLYAIERNPQRYNLLKNMVKDSNAKIVTVLNEDVLKITSKDVPGVEYILVDPSCSGSGMHSRLSVINQQFESNTYRLQVLAKLQVKILLHAMTSFPDVRKIVYSTCSLHEEENEQVVSQVIQKCRGFKLLNGRKLLNKQWYNTGASKYKHIGKKCLYAVPGKDITHGIFIAVFVRR